MSQKFQKYDLVQVAEDLGPSMRHFTSNVRAIVMYSYKEKYGGGKRESQIYDLYLEGHGECSWYEEWQLTLIARNAEHVLQEWKDEDKRLHKLHSNLDWIFSQNWDEFEGLEGSTIGALAKCLGLSENDLWGSHGEGFTYYVNAMTVVDLARPFLEKKDKNGWLKFAKAKVARVAGKSQS